MKLVMDFFLIDAIYRLVVGAKFQSLLCDSIFPSFLPIILCVFQNEFFTPFKGKFWQRDLPCMQKKEFNEVTLVKFIH
jgi:hypothetical protein